MIAAIAPAMPAFRQNPPGTLPILVRGEDRFGHSDLEPAPASGPDFDVHADSYARCLANSSTRLRWSPNTERSLVRRVFHGTASFAGRHRFDRRAETVVSRSSSACLAARIGDNDGETAHTALARTHAAAERRGFPAGWGRGRASSTRLNMATRSLSQRQTSVSSVGVRTSGAGWYSRSSSGRSGGSRLCSGALRDRLRHRAAIHRSCPRGEPSPKPPVCLQGRLLPHRKPRRHRQ